MCYQYMDSYTEIYIIHYMRYTWNRGQLNREWYKSSLIIRKNRIFHQ